jgi:SAM-dependent methyltransferase
MESDPTQRFSSRVADYIRYRPSYPEAILTWLARECGLSPQSRIADIGSGTGILSSLFLHFGCRVDGVEPNSAMRLAGERLLVAEPRFHSVEGRAEATTLPAGSADFVTAGQAYHWFDPEPARAEFRRILKPHGWVVLVWNERLVAPGFLTGYEALLQRLSSDYGRVDHRRIDSAQITRFFGHDEWRVESVPNHQDFDWDGLRGRLLSSSYAPLPGSPQYQPMMEELAALFATYQQAGQVRILYDTKAYAGQLTHGASDQSSLNGTDCSGW